MPMMNQTAMSNMGGQSQQMMMEGAATQQPRTPLTNPAQGTFFDPDTQNRLRQLEMDKVTAVQNEDYDAAKRIRTQIERLKSVGT